MLLCFIEVDKLFLIIDGVEVLVCLIRVERLVLIGIGIFLFWETLLGFFEFKGIDDGVGEGVRILEDIDCVGEFIEKIFWNGIYVIYRVCNFVKLNFKFRRYFKYVFFKENEI